MELAWEDTYTNQALGKCGFSSSDTVWLPALPQAHNTTVASEVSTPRTTAADAGAAWRPAEDASTLWAKGAVGKRAAESVPTAHACYKKP